ncbi:MAG: hypothetical protein DUD27_01155 [Lachnospiraceae bacterium]|uniref:Uncharacterized protein n=1 Tax=Candidatus Weimeria bifida TaxID=2599074 RepID=A0A6N7IXE7_9FIRM|nr:hypothetical protein [Candidatus Weimeria bifida]RRF97198.1 MAG: hypothetical protein DUD27_01155 [Lachnospiraceae bacterium]
MSEKKKTCLIKILGLVLIAVVSIFILAQTIPKSFIVRNSFKSLDKSKNTVMAMTGVTLGVSSVVAFQIWRVENILSMLIQQFRALRTTQAK